MSTIDMDAKKKTKKPNFTPTELEVLVSSIEMSLHIINSTLTNTVTNNLKKKTWADITSKVNSVSKTIRNEDEIRKKWTDLKAQTKKAESTRRGKISKTGGGPPPEELSSLESKILQLIPKCLIDGIKGGMETPIAVTATEEPLLIEPTLEIEAEPIPGCSRGSVETEEFYTPNSTPLKTERSDDKCKGLSVQAKCKVRPTRKRSACEDSTDSLFKDLNQTEEKKIKIFEDILTELKLLNCIQRERLNLERKRYLDEKSNEYSLSPIYHLENNF